MEDRRILIDTSVVIDHFRKKNKIIEFRDIFIAATDITNDMPLSTLNVKHFERENRWFRVKIILSILRLRRNSIRVRTQKVSVQLLEKKDYSFEIRCPVF